MLVVYLSLTGNVERFVNRLNVRAIKITQSQTSVKLTEPFIVIVPTYDQSITDIVSDFIDYHNNYKFLIGFIGSGNRNFDKDYIFNAKELSQKYNKPLFFDFEYSGTDSDLMKFNRDVINVDIARTE